MVEMVIVIAVGGFMLGSVLGVMALSVQMIRNAPNDTNPTVFGQLAAGTGRLESSLTASLACDNPTGANSRRDCVSVHPGSVAAAADPAARGAICWTVTGDAPASPVNADRRRLECWELSLRGDLVVRVHLPGDGAGAVSTADTSDQLTVADWATEPSAALERVGGVGLAAVGWDCVAPDGTVGECIVGAAAETVRLRTCAAVRPDQRESMIGGEVPYCDGTLGSAFASGVREPAPGVPDCVADPGLWGCIEGHLLPVLRMDPARA